MRLLNVTTLTFAEFHSPDIPKYAIASHRWSAGTEATLKSIQEKTDTQSFGYKKVKGFADYMKSNIADLQWLWIDTCCIDQKSSAELQEAINSMFRWYRDAEVCLAFLYDVSTGDDLSGFERSNWFERGWTLQELLAPSTVIFLAKEWQLIGHKGRGDCGRSGILMQTGKLLDERVASITRIPEAILHDYSESHNLSPEGKLEWAKHRQTTREEDQSYCLLGILGVSMNIRYGDGGEQTRNRLLKKLRPQTNNVVSHNSASDTKSLLPLLPMLHGKNICA